MENKAKILGLITAILVALSALLKINHLPGAGIGLVLSLGLLFPIYVIVNVISLSKDSKLSVAIILLGFFFLLFVIGFLFVVMHWPSGGLFFRFGFLLTSVMLVVLFIMNIKTGKIPTLLITLLIVLISMTYIGSFRGISRNIVEGFEKANENYTVTKGVLIRQNDSLASKLDSSTMNLIEVHKATKGLIGYIEDIKQELAKMASDNQVINDYSQIIYKENFDITNQILIVQGSAKQLKQSINDYQNRLISINSNEIVKEQIMVLLNTQDPPAIEGRVETWESSQFEHFPVISAISTLTSMQVNILISESMIMKNK